MPVLASRASLSRPSRLKTDPRENESASECPAPPASISRLSYWQVLDLFAHSDIDGNQTLEQREFSIFIGQVYPRESSRIDHAKFFASVDKDNSGNISLEEFLGWVFSVPTTGDYQRQHRHHNRHSLSSSASTGSLPSSPTLSGRGSEPMSPSSPGSPAILSRPGSSAHSRSSSHSRLASVGQQVTAAPMSPVSPSTSRSRGGRPKELVFEFTYGPDFERMVGGDSQLRQLERCLATTLGRTVRVKTKLDDTAGAHGCTRVVALLGTGIELWCTASMVQYRDNPFATGEATEDWARDMARVHVPRLLRVMNR